MSKEEVATSSKPTQYTIDQKAQEEAWKLDYDIHKHITSLNTASILILVAFIEKVFTNPSWKFLIAVALGLFVFSIVLCMLTMNHAITHIHNLGDVGKEFLGVHRLMSTASFGCFLCGVILLTIFAVKNLYG